MGNAFTDEIRTFITFFSCCSFSNKCTSINSNIATFAHTHKYIIKALPIPQLVLQVIYAKAIFTYSTIHSRKCENKFKAVNICLNIKQKLFLLLLIT